MKRFLSGLALVALSLSVIAPVAEAKRLGGGGTSGMKRTVPPKAPDAPPARPATPAPTNTAGPAAAGTAAAAAAPKRSWLGPVAGIAAGLGIAALASHLGLGAGLANVLTMVLLAAAAFFVIRFLMRRFGPQPAATQNGMSFAGAGAGAGNAAPPWQGPAFGSGAAPAQAAPAGSGVPAGFDTAGFERTAKLIFIRMQAANDAGDQADLRAFTTPEMFAAVKLDLQDRHGAAQQTDVVELNAQVVDYVQEAAQQVVSVRFHGLVREEKDAAATPFDEVWHLVRPNDGSREWAIAGIAPYA